MRSVGSETASNGAIAPRRERWQQGACEAMTSAWSSPYSTTSEACAVRLIDPLITKFVMQFWLKGAVAETVTRSIGTAAESDLDCNVRVIDDLHADRRALHAKLRQQAVGVVHDAGRGGRRCDAVVGRVAVLAAS